jgi:hypothetical protein
MVRVRGSTEATGAGKRNQLCKLDRAGSGPEPVGCHRFSTGVWAPTACGERRSRNLDSSRRAQGAGGLARSGQPAAIRAAHDPAYAGGNGRLTAVYHHVWDARRQEPSCRTRPRPTPRHLSIGAGAGLHFLYRRLLHVPLSGPGCRRRSRGDLRDLHEPSLEHDIQLLSVAAHRAARPRGSDGEFPLFRVAAPLASRGAVCDAGPHLEHDDEHVGGLVLRRGERGDYRRRQDDYIARHRCLFGAGDGGKEPCRRRLGGPGNDRSNHSLRPADVPAAGRVGRQIPVRADRRTNRTGFLVSQSAAAQPPITNRNHTGKSDAANALAIALCPIAGGRREGAPFGLDGDRRRLVHRHRSGGGICRVEDHRLCRNGGGLG